MPMDDSEGRDLESVLTELAQVTEELLATPDSDAERYLALRARRERLRKQARRMTGHGDAPGEPLDGPGL